MLEESKTLISPSRRTLPAFVDRCTTKRLLFSLQGKPSLYGLDAHIHALPTIGIACLLLLLGADHESLVSNSLPGLEQISLLQFTPDDQPVPWELLYNLTAR